MSLTPPDDGKYKVREGEWVGSIAAAYGYNDWNGDVWQRSENDDLRKTRPDPRELAPGDILFIPPRDKKDEDRSSAATHPFKIPVPNDVFRLRVLDHNKEPLKNEEYTLDLTFDEGAGSYVPSNSPTDGDGMLTETIPATTTSGVLYLPRLKQTIKLRFSRLRPIDANFDPTAPVLDEVSTRGIQQRLFNLGFNPGPIDGGLSTTTTNALQAFQQFCKDNPGSKHPDSSVTDAGDATGDWNALTRDALNAFYGS